jgi:hypothetical protein
VRPHGAATAWPPTDRGERQREAGDAQSVVSRPPNELELLFLAALDGPRRRARSGLTAEGRTASQSLSGKSRPQETDRKPDITPVAAATRPSPAQIALNRLLADPALDVRLMADDLREAAGDHRAELIRLLDDASIEKRRAAARLLAEIADDSAVGPLLAAGRDPAVHGEAIAAVGRLADVATVCDLVRREPESAVRRGLLAELLARDDSQALAAYLDFASDRRWSVETIEAADAADNVPLEALFAALRSPLQPRRIAAARVIGRIDGPAATSRLIAMVEQGRDRQEALIALLSSRGDDALRYVAGARRNPFLAPFLQAASLFVVTIPERS